jgi:hypothetical protein
MTTNGQLKSTYLNYLRREVEDLLDVGRVGLYEFIEILRGEAPELSTDQLEAYATAVLNQLLADGDVRLVWEVWAKDVPQEDATGTTPTRRDWAGPPEERYLAIDRPEL